MTKTIGILLCTMLFYKANAQQSISGNGHPITFKLKLAADIANPDTVAIIWLPLPYVEGKTVEQLAVFPKTPGTDGLYQQTISFPDSLMGKSIGYLYTASGDNYDIFRTFVLGDNQTQDRTESWGCVDGLPGKVKATRMLFIEPSSPAETTAFAKPYVGITTDGTPVKNLFPIKKTGYSTTAIKNAVTAFTATLNNEQKAASIFPVESDEWRRWHNIESWERAGICLETMTAGQKELIFNMLKESLSARGLQKAKDIMTMEAYLATLVPDNKNLGGEKYWFTFFGTPADTEPYGWQIEGHHLVINYFILGDQVVMTPVFMGSEPTRIDSGDHKGLRTFATEEKKGLDFYLSLDSVQKKAATLWNKKDFDFNRGEAFRDNEIIATTGIAASELSTSQQAALLDLVAEYVNNIKDGQAKVKMTDVKLHLKETHFTWVQGNSIESPFYYRIHSPVILIEFDHQSPVFLWDKSKPYPGPVKTHIHTVVRTPNGNDYGKDLLKEHLEKHHQHKKH
jgi:Protein of unknown function (DUF3500)